MNETISPEGVFTITRVFNAPLDLVWEAWSQCEHLSQWWGPKGFTMHTCNIEFKPGGVWHYGMRSPQGQDIWGKFTYLSIDAKNSITLINSFSDAEGGTTRNPWIPSWPLETIGTMKFVEHDGKTTLTVETRPHNATEAENQEFIDGMKGMEAGFGGTFDKLEAHLAEIRR